MISIKFIRTIDRFVRWLISVSINKSFD